MMRTETGEASFHPYKTKGTFTRLLHGRSPARSPSRSPARSLKHGLTPGRWTLGQIVLYQLQCIYLKRGHFSLKWPMIHNNTLVGKVCNG